MKNGDYILIKAPPDYPGRLYRTGYAYEHHIVYWQHYGVVPSKQEIIHHVNHIKIDNDINNLQLLTKAAHSVIHNTKRVTSICAWCGKHRQMQPSRVRVHCSRSCAAKAQHARAGKKLKGHP